MKDHFLGLLLLSTTLHGAILWPSYVSPLRVDLRSSLVSVDVVFENAEPISDFSSSVSKPSTIIPPPAEETPPEPALSMEEQTPEQTPDFQPQDPEPEPPPPPEPEKQVEPEPAESTLEVYAQAPSSPDKPAPASSLDSPPVPLAHNRPPIYPLAARRAGIQGSAVLEVEVASDGSVRFVGIDRSSGSDILDHEAMRAIRRWKFIPATTRGVTVAYPVIVPVRFVLRE